MLHKTSFISIVLVLTFVISQAGDLSIQAGRLVPKLLNYQGYLTDTLDIPINDTLDMTFKVFDAVSSGNELWSEMQTNIVIERGVFSVMLGEITPIPDSVFADFTSTWLELTLEGPQILTPRTRITSVGYAYTSTYSDTAEYARGSAGDNDWTLSSDILYPSGDYGLSMRSGNVLFGDSARTHVNFGVACTTGTSGQNYRHCAVGGGRRNIASHNYATVAGGYQNTTTGTYATIGGGSANTAYSFATVAGGYFHNASYFYATIGGGYQNTASGLVATVAGGEQNTASGAHTTVGGGFNNNASEDYAFIGGGWNNSATGSCSGVMSGYFNDVTDTCSVICGGYRNHVASKYSAILGGYADTIATGAILATITGGYDNSITGYAGVITGGAHNKVDGQYSVVGGGYGNVVEGICSAILGGDCDTIFSGADFSYLFGINSNLTQDSTFMVDMPHIRFGDETNGYEFPTQDGSDGQLLTTDGSGQLGWTDPVPSGVIVMWSGSIAAIPDGWVLCNGTNGTPDLRDRFLVGAGNTYSVDDSGGEVTHTLTISEMPAHAHGDSVYGNTSWEGSHQHDIPVVDGNEHWNNVDIGGSGIPEWYDTDPAGNHDHSFSATISSEGSGQAHENRPPYYALAYIMKL